jgi:two-component system sensor histidine kinase CreC
MSLRAKILLVFAGGLLLGFGAFAFSVRDRLRQSYGQNAEELMVDTAHVLAALVEQESAGVPDPPSTAALERLWTAYKARPIRAQLFELEKVGPALDLYVTDARGIVRYSSENAADVGRDFSRWRDVRLTLAGRYGARSTRRDPSDKRTSVFYVGAPIHDASGRIVGSLSLVKHRESVAGMIEGALRKMLWLGLLVVAMTLAMGALLFQWITLPLGRLEAYVRSISAGRQTPLPPLRGGEIGELGRAFEEMRVAVEGKKEVERMAQALSHELKSPLSAIQGAAELLREEVSPVQKERFLTNILGESQRAHAVVERLLEVTALESRSALERRETLCLRGAVDAAREGLLGLFGPRRIRVSVEGGERVEMEGDPFLVQQAIRNVLQNAIEFSPEETEVRVRIERAAGEARVVVEDAGAGVPDFARPRLFEKFFSLERPSTGRKGSGLGLSFVQEVMTLHGGRVGVESPLSERGGTRVLLAFPVR